MRVEEQAEQKNETCAESARLADLHATGILDTPADHAYDTITSIAASYFHVEWAGISFADAQRIWVKSYCGKRMRELPRRNSIFDMVIAKDGPLIIGNIADFPELDGSLLSLKVLDAAFVAAAPIRSRERRIIGLMIVYDGQPRALDQFDMATLEGLADLVGRELELRRCRAEGSVPVPMKRPSSSHLAEAAWPTAQDLHDALEQNQLRVYYQPELNLVTREIVALEALLRWEHPERGLVPPSDFIPLAESNGMILPIGDWVLSEVCRQICEWSSSNLGLHSLRVCVNLSAQQFAREGLADHIGALLLNHDLGGHQLGLELTESSLISNEQTAMRILRDLRKLGVAVLLDDFGTGYSSLNYLHSFPFDYLKLDRTFINRMLDAESSFEIVRSVINLAGALGMQVVAEGIESRTQYQILRAMGCHCGQGYLFSKPVPPAKLQPLLELPGLRLSESQFTA